MTSEVYVWIWLPGATAPVVAGKIASRGGLHSFTYGRSYRELAGAIPLSPFELPLEAGEFVPAGMRTIHACLRDAAPDSWGRRLIAYRQGGAEPDELGYMLFSGSDRVGALDFQLSPTEYVPRDHEHASIEELMQAAERVEKGEPLPPALEAAILHGTSVGGARPKALITHDHGQYIAKFSSTTDTYAVVKAEYIGMRLAALAGLDVARVRLQAVANKDLLLVERFDRVGAGARRLMLSGLGLLSLGEMEGRYASYLDLADIIRQRFADPKGQLAELYRRLMFNVIIGNTDDHARNHAAFWDGRTLELTPAYDICPQIRTGQEASQAMDIGGVDGRLSKLGNVLSVCGRFLLRDQEAQGIRDSLVDVVETHWTTVCDEAGLPPTERERLWGRAVLNPFCFQ